MQLGILDFLCGKCIEEIKKSSKKKVSQTVKGNETTAAVHGFLWLGKPTAAFWSLASIGSSKKPTTIWLDQYISATSSAETRPDTCNQYSSVLSSEQVFILNIHKRKTCLQLLAAIY